MLTTHDMEQGLSQDLSTYPASRAAARARIMERAMTSELPTRASARACVMRDHRDDRTRSIQNSRVSFGCARVTSAHKVCSYLCMRPLGPTSGTALVPRCLCTKPQHPDTEPSVVSGQEKGRRRPTSDRSEMGSRVVFCPFSEGGVVGVGSSYGQAVGKALRPSCEGLRWAF